MDLDERRIVVLQSVNQRISKQRDRMMFPSKDEKEMLLVECAVSSSSNGFFGWNDDALAV